MATFFFINMSKYIPQYQLLNITPTEFNPSLNNKGISSVFADDDFNQNVLPDHPVSAEDKVFPEEHLLGVPLYGEQDEESPPDTQPKTELDTKSESSKDYIVILNNSIIFKGSFSETEDEVSKLILGEHKLCKNNEPYDKDKVLVFKKVNIKVGVFLE